MCVYIYADFPIPSHCTSWLKTVFPCFPAFPMGYHNPQEIW